MQCRFLIETSALHVFSFPQTTSSSIIYLLISPVKSPKQLERIQTEYIHEYDIIFVYMVCKESFSNPNRFYFYCQFK